MRKNFTPLILAGLVISLGYSHFTKLTKASAPVVKFEVDVQPEGRIKTRSLVRNNSTQHTRSAPRENNLSVYDEYLYTAESSPILLSYLNQLKPESKEELEAVLNVAAEAQEQLLQEQPSTQEALETMKSKIISLAPTLSADLEYTVERHLENLDRQREIKRNIAFLNEQWQGWSLEADAGLDRRETLAAAERSLQNLQNELEALDVELNDHEVKLLGPEYQTYRQLLNSYKKESAAALDQELILDKFDSIFAAMHSARLD